MTAKERILVAVERANGPVCDDCMVKLANLGARQVAYNICTSLVAEGAIGRDNNRTCIICGKIKLQAGAKKMRISVLGQSQS